MTDFEWPWQYSFPPFFTLQPTLATREKQLEAWSNLILNYYRAHKGYVLDVAEALASPLFHNKDISRKLSADALREILKSMSSRGQVAWTDKQQTRCYVFWRSPGGVGKAALRLGRRHRTPQLRVHFLRARTGRRHSRHRVRWLDVDLLRLSLQALEKQGKAELITFDGSEGVKFF
uniref:Vacuolar protein-sorting-associated protein 25 n=1 Tax=Amblyomma tuberculatum TaxID=48802 RepID=A0A6M2E4H3_9ACAR